MRWKQRGLPGWRAILLGLSWPAMVSAQQWAEPAVLPVAPPPQSSTSPQGQAQACEPPAPWQPLQRSIREVEILHGNRRVWPPPSSRPLPILIIPVVATAPSSTTEKATHRPDKEEAKPAVVESRTIILASHAGVIAPAGEPLASTAPWLSSSASPAMSPHSGGYLAPWAMPPVLPSYSAPASPAPPQVIVLKDRDGDAHSSPNPSAATTEQVRGITLSPELLLGVSAGIIGLGVGAWGWRRRKTVSPTRGMHPLPYVPMGGEGVLLMGRYNAGPRPTTAERFEIGPSYAAMREEKKKIEAQNQQALVEFILGQNVALHAEVFGSAAADSLPMAEECHDLESHSTRLEKTPPGPVSHPGQ